MNATNHNRDAAQPEDPSDRLIDVALIELIGGQSPPDLSSKITTAYPQTQSIEPMVPKPDRRVVWSVLAVAAVLMIGVTCLLLPAVKSARETARASTESARQNRLGSHDAPSPPFMQASTTPTPAEAAKGGRVAVTGQGPGREAPQTNSTSPASINLSTAVDDLSLVASTTHDLAQASQPHDGQELVPPTPGGPTHETVASTSETITWFNKVSGRDGRELLPSAIPRLARETEASPMSQVKVEVTNSSTLSGGTSPLSTRTVALNDSYGIAPEAQAPKAGFEMKDRYSSEFSVAATPTPTTTQLINEIRQLQRQGKPTDQLKKELQRRNERSVDLSALTDEGTGPGASGDKYTRIVENPFIKAEGGDAVSTFSIDVDTASYTNVRQFLLGQNQLPPPDAVRIEELVNYFQYNYEPPKPADEAPFAAHVEITACPWAPEHRLARIGIKGREIDRAKRPQSNLVFLIDVSGSMDEPNKLPLVIKGLEQLARELGENDKVAIVVYASSEGLVLPSTRGDKQDTILAALSKLKAGGSTAGGAGIQLAYQLAEDNFIQGGTNRVILCTDGDFNVGVTSTAELERLVEKKAKDTGVFLSVLGFGRGNLNDAMMEAISNHGNGNYHYVDNRREARRVLVEQMTGTLITIAKDVKIQVEFNPEKVAGYRLIGYEDRMLRTEDFNNDKKDAGEIGAGHTVTALYEVIPAGKKVEVAPVDDLKYQQPVGRTTRPSASPGDGRIVHPTTDPSSELLTLKMRYKAPDGDTSKKLEWAITDDGKSFSAASEDMKFASSVAGFGMLLRNSQFKGNLTSAAVIELAQNGLGEDNHGYRKEFVEMVRKAKELRHE